MAALLAALLFPATLVAQDGTSDRSPSALSGEERRARALALYSEAQQHYRAGEIAESVTLLEEAYTLNPNPVLLFNMARAQEALGAEAEAIDSYERYLEAEPDAPDRGAVVSRIEALEASLHERARLEAEREAAERQREEAQRQREAAERERRAAEARARESRGRRALPWIVGATGAAGAVAGLVFGGVAESRRDDAVAEPEHAQAIELDRDARRWARVSTGFLIGGGVLAAAGFTWGIVSVARRSRNEEALRVTVGPMGVSARLRFP
ncbi:MAG: hypothetical protein AAF411_14650 [Myxococcota bacterium]